MFLARGFYDRIDYIDGMGWMVGNGTLPGC